MSLKKQMATAPIGIMPSSSAVPRGAERQLSRSLEESSSTDEASSSRPRRTTWPSLSFLSCRVAPLWFYPECTLALSTDGLRLKTLLGQIAHADPTAGEGAGSFSGLMKMTDGIYRTSPLASRLTAFMASTFARGDLVDPKSVASAVKTLLRTSPFYGIETLLLNLTTRNYCADLEKDGPEHVGCFLRSLKGEGVLACLAALMLHFGDIAANHAVNQMTAENLAKVVLPNLCPGTDLVNAKDPYFVAMAWLITNAEKLFAGFVPSR